MLFARNFSRSSGCTKSSHSRVLRGIRCGSTPMSRGSVSDQLSNDPSGPVITCPSLAMACARCSPASLSPSAIQVCSRSARALPSASTSRVARRPICERHSSAPPLTTSTTIRPSASSCCSRISWNTSDASTFTTMPRPSTNQPRMAVAPSSTSSAPTIPESGTRCFSTPGDTAPRNRLSVCPLPPRKLGHAIPLIRIKCACQFEYSLCLPRQAAPAQFLAIGNG